MSEYTILNQPSPSTTARAMPLSVSNAVGFWMLAGVLGVVVFAASAPSPLYALYAAKWHFSSITLTAIFGVYAFALLIALLTIGKLSDYLGRRPVLAVALLIQIAGMLTFAAAQGVAALCLARVLQGLGTGIAMSAIPAWLLDLEPANRPGSASVVGSIVPNVGLAGGALGSGTLVQCGPDPLRLVYWLLAAVFLLAVVTLPCISDVVPRSRGWVRSVRPSMGVPVAAHALFAAAIPALVATWALSGLYLSLGPSLAVTLLADQSSIASGLVIATLAGSGAIASIVARTRSPHEVVIGSSLALVAGVGITILAVVLSSAVVLYAGTLVAGLGFGPVFSGVFRSLAPLALPEERGALLASIYVVSYLALSIPAIAAGLAVAQWDLRSTTYAYGAIVMTLAAVTTIAVSRSQRRI